MSATNINFPLQRMMSHIDVQLRATGNAGYINKVETTRSNRLYFEFVKDNEINWYRWENEELQKMDVARDKKIPLAGKLADKAFFSATKLLSYRPKRRLTLMDMSGQKARILKGFRRGHLDAMVSKYESAHAAFSGRGINAPDIIEYDTGNECLVMVYEPGKRLSLSADTTDLFHLVGEALRGFQDNATDTGEPRFDSHDELAVIDKRAARLQQVAGQLPEQWPELRHRLESAHEHMPPAAWGLAHRDLHDKQFVQHANYLTLLDFDLMCMADTTLDPANFLAHLVLRNLQGVQGATQRSIDACGKQFLQGLSRNTEPGFWERLRFYQASSFCRLALVYVLRPQWKHVVPDLVTMGNRCLDDLQRIRDH